MDQVGGHPARQRHARRRPTSVPLQPRDHDLFRSARRVAHDIDSRPTRNWGALGIQGLAPYFFDLELTGYVSGEGHLAAKLEGSYDLLLTQRLILQPQVKVNLYSKADPVRMVGAGFSHIDTGLRLRYEFSRNFAPISAWSMKENSARPRVSRGGRARVPVTSASSSASAPDFEGGGHAAPHHLHPHRRNFCAAGRLRRDHYRRLRRGGNRAALANHPLGDRNRPHPLDQGPRGRYPGPAGLRRPSEHPDGGRTFRSALRRLPRRARGVARRYRPRALPSSAGPC